MNNTTTVQPFTSGENRVTGSNPDSFSDLISCGVDEAVAKDLLNRLGNSKNHQDKFAAASRDSFVGTVVRLNQPGFRLISVR